jgi:hypothetical protein
MIEQVIPNASTGPTGPSDDSQLYDMSGFAEMMRGKFPGKYDDIDDSTLTTRILNKYPQYQDMVDMSAPVKKKDEDEPISLPAVPESTDVAMPSEPVPSLSDGEQGSLGLQQPSVDERFGWGSPDPTDSSTDFALTLSGRRPRERQFGEKVYQLMDGKLSLVPGGARTKGKLKFDDDFYVRRLQSSGFTSTAKMFEPFRDKLDQLSPTITENMRGMANGEVFSFDAIDAIADQIAKDPELTQEIFDIYVDPHFLSRPITTNPMVLHSTAAQGELNQVHSPEYLHRERKRKIQHKLTRAMYDDLANNMLMMLPEEDRTNVDKLQELEQEAFDQYQLMIDLDGNEEIGNKPLLHFDGFFSTGTARGGSVPQFSGYLADMASAGYIDLTNAFMQWWAPNQTIRERRERAEQLRATTLQFTDEWDDASWMTKTRMTLGSMAEGTPLFLATAPLQIMTGARMNAMGFGTNFIIGTMAMESTSLITMQEMARLRDNPEWNIYKKDGKEYTYDEFMLATGGDPEKQAEYTAESDDAAKWGYLGSIGATTFAVDGLTTAMFMRGLTGMNRLGLAGPQYKKWWRFHLANMGIATTTAGAASGLAAMQQYAAQQVALGRDLTWNEMREVGEQASVTGAGYGLTMSGAGTAVNSMIGAVALSRDKFGRARMNVSYLKQQEQLQKLFMSEKDPEIQLQLRDQLLKLEHSNLKRQLVDQEFYRAMAADDRDQIIDISQEANRVQRMMMLVGEDSPLYEGFQKRLTDLLKRRDNIESLYEAQEMPVRYDDDGNLLERDPFAEGQEIPISQREYADEATRPGYGSTTPMPLLPPTPIRDGIGTFRGYDSYQWYESLVDRYHSIVKLQENLMERQQHVVLDKDGNAKKLGDRPVLNQDVEAQLRLMDSKGFAEVTKVMDELVYGKEGIAYILSGSRKGLVGKTRDLVSGNKSTNKILSENADALNAVMPQVDGQPIPLNPLNVFNQYLYARHAPERNAHIYAKNKAEYEALARKEAPTAKEKARMRDLQRYMDEKKGSGMSDDQAAAFLDALPPELRATMEAAEAKAKQILTNTQENLLKYGFISQERFNQLQTQFEHYVPLFGKSIGDTRMIDPNTGELTIADPAYSRVPGKQQTIENKFLREAKGRADETGDVFAKLMMQNMETIVMGERNLAMQRLHNLMADNPSDMFRISDSGKQDAANTQVVFMDGEKKYLEFFNRDGSPDEFMLDGFKKTSMDFTGQPLMDNIWAMFSRLSDLRKVHVNYNPLFGPYAFTRDNFTAISNAVMLTENQYGYGLRAEDGRPIDSGAYVRAVGDPTSLMRSWGIVARSEMTPLSDVPYYAEWKQAGGQTGWTMLMPMKELAAKLDQVTDPAKRDKITQNWGVKNYAKMVESWNATWENAVRFNAYRKAREQGMSVDMAANISKEITVNFNRNGHEAAKVGALKYFFNPAVQGSDQIMRTFFGRNAQASELDVFGHERSWAEQRAPQLKVAGAFTLLGAMQTMWNLNMGGEDETGVAAYDHVKNWELASRVTYLDPDDNRGRRVGFNLPYGHGLFYLMGVVGTEMAMGQRDPVSGALLLQEGLVHHMAPVYIGGKEEMPADVVEGMGGPSIPTAMVGVATPDYMKPIVDVYANRRALDGRPVYYDDPSTADAYEAVRAPEWYQAPFKMLSDGMGAEGSSFVAGDYLGFDLSYNPDISWYLMESYIGANAQLINQGKNLQREIMFENLTPDVVEGYVKPTDIPFLNKFVRETPREEIMGRYFDFRTRMDPYKQEFQDYINADMHYGKSQVYRESRMAELNPEDREFRYLAWLSTTDLQYKLSKVMYGDGMGTLDDIYSRQMKDLIDAGLETDEEKLKYKELRDKQDQLDDTRITLMITYLKFAQQVAPPRVKQ